MGYASKLVISTMLMIPTPSAQEDIVLVDSSDVTHLLADAKLFLLFRMISSQIMESRQLPTARGSREANHFGYVKKPLLDSSPFKQNSVAVKFISPIHKAIMNMLLCMGHEFMELHFFCHIIHKIAKHMPYFLFI